MKRLTGHLYFWVLFAILSGGTLGCIRPETGVALKPLGDGFNEDAATLDATAVADYAKVAASQSGPERPYGRLPASIPSQPPHRLRHWSAPSSRATSPPSFSAGPTSATP